MYLKAPSIALAALLHGFRRLRAGAGEDRHGLGQGRLEGFRRGDGGEAQVGEFRFDDLHPSGSERAARIAACAAVLPPSAVPALTPATVMAPANPVSVYGCEAQLWIDRVPVGVVSNVRAAAGRLTLPAREPGIRAYTIVLHQYYLEQALQLTPMGTVEATGTVAVAAGDTLMVDWTPGATPTLRTLR
jgi:hypothetical protein